MCTTAFRRGVWGVSHALLAACAAHSASGQIVNESVKLLASDGSASDFFGVAVSLSGDAAIVGAMWDDHNGYRAGSAYIFRRNGSSWVQEQKLLPSDPGEDNQFGRTVSVSGDTAVVGSPGTLDYGAAYVFRWNPGSPGSWVQEQKLVPSDGAQGGSFGYFVSVSGDVAVVGSPANNGSAYVFRWNGSSWGEEQKLLASDGAPLDYFGEYLSVSGDMALMGARYDDDNGPNSGSAYVFRWRPGDPPNWIQEQKLLASDGAVDDEFGSFVSISGNVALIGAWADDDNGPNSGSAYVFRWNGSSWVQEQKLIASDGAENNQFGTHVDISGEVALVSAPQDDDNGSASGSAYVFRRNPGRPIPWVQEMKLLASDGEPGDVLGTAVSVSGNVAIVGASWDDGNAPDSGSAYVFNLVCDPGYYGPMCAECPGGAGNPCNGHGTCDDGVSGTGQCTCDAGWGGASCSEVLGTCCVSNGSCETAGNCQENITPSECQALGGRFLGPNVSCAQACVNGACIPTISAWGIIVLLLLVATAGTIVLAHRRVPAG